MTTADTDYVTELADQLRHRHPDLVSAENDLAVLRGRIAIVATFIHNPAYDDREGGPHFRIYECRYCGLHHFGHPPGHATYLRRGQPLEPTT